MIDGVPLAVVGKLHVHLDSKVDEVLSGGIAVVVSVPVVVRVSPEVGVGWIVCHINEIIEFSWLAHNQHSLFIGLNAQFYSATIESREWHLYAPIAHSCLSGFRVDTERWKVPIPTSG